MVVLFQDRDVFVDLGSGVGQLVIHMAGGSKVRKAVGIEIASLPNRYAQNLSVEFKKYIIIYWILYKKSNYKIFQEIIMLEKSQISDFDDFLMQINTSS